MVVRWPLEERRWGRVVEDGPTLVVLHEGLGSVSLWRDFPQKLQAATGLGVLAYSRLGYGGSPAAAPAPWPADFMEGRGVEELVAVLQAQGIEDCVLVGHSDGASIALAAAARGVLPGCRGLVLMAPHVFVEERTVAAIGDAVRRFAAGSLRHGLERHHGENTEATFAAWSEVWLSERFRDWSLVRMLVAVAVPQLVLQSRDDPYGTLAQVRAIAAGTAGESRTLVLEGSGHAPHVQHAEYCVAAIAAFVAGLARE